MKKVIWCLTLIIMMLGVATVVNATSSSELADKIYEKAKPYGMTEANRVRIERYVKDNNISDEEVDKVLAKIDEGVEIFKTAKADRYSALSDSQKDRIKSIANETATILGLTLKFKTREAEIYKNGKLIEVARYDGDRYVYTGNSVNPVLVVSSVAGIALIAGFIARKKFANA